MESYAEQVGILLHSYFSFCDFYVSSKFLERGGKPVMET